MKTRRGFIFKFLCLPLALKGLMKAAPPKFEVLPPIKYSDYLLEYDVRDLTVALGISLDKFNAIYAPVEPGKLPRVKK